MKEGKMDFKTIKQNCTAEIVEKKSRFIANVFYIETVEQAEEYIKKIKKQYETVKKVNEPKVLYKNNSIIEKILLDTLGDEYNFPIIKSNNFGHTDKKTVIPIGTLAKIDTSKKVKIELIEKYF